VAPLTRTTDRAAKQTINQYYKATDMSATYRIAMLLYPRHKTRYLEKASWPKSWIDDTLEMLHEEYDAKYR
ncbi:hypothetical protein OH76DRAFT_1307680, partial [Lentinus brumalis]